MKNLTFSVLAALALLGSGYSLAHAERSTTPISPSPERSYLCVSSDSAGDVMEKANQLGSQGWKLTTGAASGRGAIWCFERYGVHPATRDK